MRCDVSCNIADLDAFCICMHTCAENDNVSWEATTCRALGHRYRNMKRDVMCHATLQIWMHSAYACMHVQKTTMFRGKRQRVVHWDIDIAFLLVEYS